MRVRTGRRGGKLEVDRVGEGRIGAQGGGEKPCLAAVSCGEGRALIGQDPEVIDGLVAEVEAALRCVRCFAVLCSAFPVVGDLSAAVVGRVGRFGFSAYLRLP